MDAVDDFGHWTGTCEACGTSHDGYPPDTVGGLTRCLRARASALGAASVLESLDDLDARQAERREGAVRDFLADGPGATDA